MAYQQIRYRVGGGVATVTLHRPEKLNAWTPQMESEFGEALGEAAGDESVRLIVVTGAGRGFCAGADMSLLNALAAESQTQETPAVGVQVREWPGSRGQWRRPFAWMLSLPKPVVAAINGPAVGIGFVIPLYCDLRVAAASAGFSVIFSRRGLIAEYGIAWMLPRLIGLPNALDLLLTSRTISADEALRIGLVTRVLPDADFGEAVQEWAARTAAEVSPRSLAVIKKQVWDAQCQNFPEAFDASLDQMRASLQSEDFREGVAHYLEKRPPRFTGR